LSASHRSRGAVALLFTLAALAGCGDDDSSQPPAGVEGVGQPIGGSVAPLAQCRDWRRGSAPERLATIEDIRGQLTPQSSASAESDLSDEEAYDLFERVCANDFASSFRLYKIYAQRAAFKPLDPG
jgi:hypothetical protein